MSLKDTIARQILSRALALVKECLWETRDIIEGLYSPVLRDFGLVAMIDEELRRFQDDTGCQTKFDARCPDRLPRDIEVTAYRIFREALTNVRRHATDAKQVQVSLACKNRVLNMQVKDDGQGFNVLAEMGIKQVGGLLIMRHRAEIAGGTFDIESLPGMGTTVTVSLPYDRIEETEQPVP